MTVKKETLWFLAVLLLIIAYPINFRVVSFLRLADVVFIALFAIALFSGNLKRSSVNPLAFLFMGFLALTLLWGTIRYGFLDVSFAFLYKYAVIFLLSWFISSADIGPKQMEYLLRSMAATYLFLVVYVFYYQYLVISGAGLPMRPDFPFTNMDVEKFSSAGHLYGAYIGMGIAALLSYFILFIKNNWFLWAAIFSASLAALVLTGSRAPIIAIGAGFMLLVVLSILDKKRFGVKKKAILYGVILIVAVTFVYSYYLSNSGYFGLLDDVVSRTFTFNNPTDGSIGSRIDKSNYGIEQVFSNSVVLGVSPAASPFIWVDNSLVRIMIDTGVGGLIIFTLFLFYVNKKIFRRAVENKNIPIYYIVLITSVVYVMNNLSTEFFLVTRSVFPYLILVGLLCKLISIPNKAKLEVKEGKI